MHRGCDRELSRRCRRRRKLQIRHAVCRREKSSVPDDDYEEPEDEEESSSSAASSSKTEKEFPRGGFLIQDGKEFLRGGFLLQDGEEFLRGVLLQGGEQFFRGGVFQRGRTFFREQLGAGFRRGFLRRRGVLLRFSPACISQKAEPAKGVRFFPGRASVKK